MIDFAAARKHMLDSQVRPNDVTEPRLLAALESLPREAFLPSRLKDVAYVEREIVYSPGRRLLTARDFAKLAAAADVLPADSVLDIACGTGYSTAVLSRLAARVTGVESDPTLAASARETLRQVGADNVEIVEAEPAAGAPQRGPFDVIFLAGAIGREPTALLAQLRDGGRLAVIRREDGVSRGVVYTRKDGVATPRTVFDAATTAILPGFEAPRVFAF